MTIYNATAQNMADALNRLAGAIENYNSKPTYNVFVIVGPEADSSDIEAKVTATLERTQAREHKLGDH